MLKKKKIIHFLSFLLWLFFFSLLLFSSFFIWNLRLFLIFCHSLFPFSSSEISPLPFSFLFSITFFAPLSLSLSLRLDHCHWDRPSPWSLAWWRSYVSLASFFFFFWGLWIPCDLGCINRVDSSLHFFLESFMLILGIFFKSSIGSWWQLVDCCWWWWVVPMGDGGGLYLWVVVVGCACVWWWVYYNSVLMFVYGGRFLFCIFFYIDGFFNVFFNIFIYYFNI